MSFIYEGPILKNLPQITVLLLFTKILFSLPLLISKQAKGHSFPGCCNVF